MQAPAATPLSLRDKLRQRTGMLRTVRKCGLTQAQSMFQSEAAQSQASDLQAFMSEMGPMSRRKAQKMSKNMMPQMDATQMEQLYRQVGITPAQQKEMQKKSKAAKPKKNATTGQATTHASNTHSSATAMSTSGTSTTLSEVAPLPAPTFPASTSFSAVKVQIPALRDLTSSTVTPTTPATGLKQPTLRVPAPKPSTLKATHPVARDGSQHMSTSPNVSPLPPATPTHRVITMKIPPTWSPVVAALPPSKIRRRIHHKESSPGTDTTSHMRTLEAVEWAALPITMLHPQSEMVVAAQVPDSVLRTLDNPQVSKCMYTPVGTNTTPCFFERTLVPGRYLRHQSMEPEARVHQERLQTVLQPFFQQIIQDGKPVRLSTFHTLLERTWHITPRETNLLDTNMLDAQVERRTPAVPRSTTTIDEFNLVPREYVCTLPLALRRDQSDNAVVYTVFSLFWRDASVSILDASYVIV